MSSTRVFIGRLPHVARESDIERFFKGYGKIREISLKEGYGFVEFGERRDAEDAVYEMNGKELCGDRVIVDHARQPGERRPMRGGRGGGYGGGYGGGGYGGRFRGGGGGGYDRFPPRRNPPPQHSDYRVRVSNLSSRVSWQDLKDYMRQAGDVVYADAHRIRSNEGVVEFASSADMKNAIEKLNDTELSGRRIEITEDRGRDSGRRRHSRSRSYSRSRSRSASRSRSRSRDGDRPPADRKRSASGEPVHGAGRSPSRSRSPSPGYEDNQQ